MPIKSTDLFLKIIKINGKLYNTLKKVHVHLIEEGYRIEKDKIIPPKMKNKIQNLYQLKKK